MPLKKKEKIYTINPEIGSRIALLREKITNGSELIKKVMGYLFLGVDQWWNIMAFLAKNTKIYP